MEINSVYNGFLVESINTIKELDATMYIMEHEKSGAKLCYLDYDDTNMVFSICFNTTPENDTGVFHILEHSVLNGSDKFPLKEPFVELLKGSMQTFLNAMTFADKTIYPVASQNEKDFMNLMDVYMDAVFHPLICSKKEIFMQEGWHSVWSENENKVIKTGVVYNEMKGVFSNPTSLLRMEVNKTLFPDTPYKFVSGGKPESILDLSYERFVDVYQKHYYPGNSYIFLGGKMNVEEKLRFLDEKYLSSFEKKERIPFIPIQKPIGSNNNSVIEYQDSNQNSSEDNCYFALNYVIDKADNIELNLAVQVLEYVLFDCRVAPIRKKLLERNLAKDINVIYDSSIKQPVFSIMGFHTNESNKQVFCDCIKEELLDIVKKGLDKELVESAITNLEFQLKENEFGSNPRGLVYNLGIMGCWLHGWSPEKALQYEKELAEIREKAKSGYFEQLIERLFLKSNHSSFVVLKPSKIDREIADENKESLSEKEKELLIKENKQFVSWQNEKDTDEIIKRLPQLKLTDISDKIEYIPREVKYIGNTPVLYHNIKAKGISYIKYYFNMTEVTVDQLRYMKLFMNLLGNISTKKYSKEQLLTKKGRLFGDLSFGVNVFKNTDGIIPVLLVSMKTLEKDVMEALELLEEILYESDFSDIKEVEETLWTIVSQFEVMLNQQGNVAAARRIKAHYSVKGAYEEYVYGIENYKFLKKAAMNFQSSAGEIINIIKQLAKQILCRKNIIFSYTGDEKGYEAFESFNKEYINIQHTDLIPTEPDIAMVDYNKEAFYNSGLVQYVCSGGICNEEYMKHFGKMQVLGKILSLSYLWNEVRVKGGAYGSWFNADREGNCIFTSFRDPNLTQTVECYMSTVEFLKDFKVSKDEMDKFIIGTLSDVDKPRTKDEKGFISDKRYFEGITEEMILNERKDILSTTQKDIQCFSSLINEILRQDQICIVGNKEKIEVKKDIFQNIQPLII